MFVEQHDARVDAFLGDKKFHWKFFGGRKIESPSFDYPILFGIEMEYEVDTPEEELEAKLYRAQVVERLEPSFKHFAIAKHDGSLKNGFEVVSVPMSLDAHTEQWKKFFEIAEDNDLLVKTNCGMHVHVSRELLTPLHIGKMLSFISDKGNEPFIKKIAGRSKPVYIGEKKYADIGTRKITDVNHHSERYSALNIQGSETIEFRFFKSTLELERMIANLEFCDALLRFTWPSQVGIRQIREDGLKLFFKFVLENRKQFPRLANFMRDSNYISWKQVPSRYNKAAIKDKPSSSKPKKVVFKKYYKPVYKKLTWDHLVDYEPIYYDN